MAFGDLPDAYVCVCRPVPVAPISLTQAVSRLDLQLKHIASRGVNLPTDTGRQATVIKTHRRYR